MTLVPYVVEITHRGERAMDIWSRLLKDRIVFIGQAPPFKAAKPKVSACRMYECDLRYSKISWTHRPWLVHHASLLELEKRRGVASGLRSASHRLPSPRTTATLQ